MGTTFQKGEIMLDKAIKHGKERRKPYHGPKAFDGSCRNHGGCPFCEEGRQHFDRKARTAANDQIKDYWKETE